METISNGIVKVVVSPLGAELQSVVKNGHEYLWQGDEKYWNRRSPVLFPIVGRVYDNVYRYKGGSFEIGQHGFARDMNFELKSRSEDEVVFQVEDNEETLAIYPSKFRLTIGYKLEGNAVVVSWTVENIGNEKMSFQIGAHPAFNYPDFKPEADERGFFTFDNQNPLEYIIPVGKGCTSPEKYVLQRDDQNAMPVKGGTFDCDTYVFEDNQIRKVTLCGMDRKPYVSVEFDMPLVALWSPSATKPDCPFVCIEPWCGRCDTYGYDGMFEDRPWMWHLNSGEIFQTSYKIILE